MRKDTLLPGQPKAVYRVTNWPEYNAGLIERGNVTVWMDERMFSPALQPPGQRGRPQAYCDGVIQMLLALKSVYRLPLRALQGFAISLQQLALPGLLVPNYSRAQPKGQVAAGEPASAAQHGRGSASAGRQHRAETLWRGLGRVNNQML